MVTNVNRAVEIQTKTRIFILNTFVYFIFFKQMFLSFQRILKL